MAEAPKYDFDDLKKSPTSSESQKDFKQLVTDAVQDKRLTKEERSEIIKLVNQMDQEKVKVHQDTINSLKKFAKDNGYTGFNANLEKSLQGANQKVAEKPTASPEKPTEAPSAPAEAEKPTASPEKPTEAPSAPVEEPKNQDGLLDKAGRFFTGKLDIASLPKEDQAAIKDLQDAGFRFKAVEGKTGEYSVDMNGLADKSKIDLKNKTFTTDMLKKDGKDFTTSFNDTTEAKDKMTKANSLIDTMAQLSPLEKIYDTHRTSQEQDNYQKLTAQKATLEKDLGIAAPAPKAAGAEGGK